MPHGMLTLPISWQQEKSQLSGRHRTRSSSLQRSIPMFKYCADHIIRRCVPEEENQGILSHCYVIACGGHFAS